MTANQRGKASRSSGESRRRKSGVPSPKRSAALSARIIASYPAVLPTLSPFAEGPCLKGWKNVTAPARRTTPRIATISGPVFGKLFTIGTPQTGRLGNAVHAIRAESPSAFLAIHTPTKSQNENGLKTKENTSGLKCAVRKSVSQAQRMCFHTHRI